jgi:beta-lactamase class A
VPEATPAPVEATPEPTPEPTPTPVPLSGLEPVLAEMTASYGGEWGIWIKDLKTSEELNLNSHQMRSASLIKLFTAGRYFQAVEAGEIQATEKTEKYLQKMISCQTMMPGWHWKQQSEKVPTRQDTAV